MVGIAIFGLGRAGTIHAKNIMAHPKCRIRYVVDPCEKAVAVFQGIIPTAFHDIQVLSAIDDNSLDCIFNDGMVTAVFVCSTTGSHYGIVKRAIEHGKAVFCEKPISVDVGETEALYRLAMEKNIPLHCSFNRRYDPQVREMYNRVRSDKFGSIHVVKTCSRDHPCPSIEFLRDSGGFFHDCATHDLDMVCWLVGSLPERVFVTASAQDAQIKELGDVDTAVIVLNFPTTASNNPGPIAVIDISRHGCYGYDQRVEVLSDGGMLRSENQLAADILCNMPGETKTGQIKHSFPQRYRDSYINSLNFFVKCVMENHRAEITARDVINISRLAHACDESLACGKPVEYTPVDLDF